MKKYIPAFTLIALGVSARLLPHAANFAPIAAIALFSGLYLPKRLAIIVPAMALLLSDIVLGFYTWQVVVSVYACFALTGIIGLGLAKQKNFAAIALGTILASIIFFLVTNWAVWAFGTMYPHTTTGLMQSYVMALPFFRNSLLGDIFYTTVLVGSMELVQKTSLSKIKAAA